MRKIKNSPHYLGGFITFWYLLSVVNSIQKRLFHAIYFFILDPVSIYWICKFGHLKSQDTFIASNFFVFKYHFFIADITFSCILVVKFLIFEFFEIVFLYVCHMLAGTQELLPQPSDFWPYIHHAQFKSKFRFKHEISPKLSKI